MTSTFRLAIATIIGICIGLILGMILFSASPHHSSIDFTSSCNTKSDNFQQTNKKIINIDNDEQTTQPEMFTTSSLPQTTQNNDEHQNPQQDLFSISTFKPWNCESNFDVDEIRQRYLKINDEKNLLFSKDSLHLTVQHFRAVMKILKNDEFKKCWRKIKQNRISFRKMKNSNNNNQFFFYDLGSRKLDQTQNFLQLYPGGRNYNIICYEPNPTFNAFYQKAGNPKIFHLNAAVGIAVDTLKLSDRHVGSSIINEKNKNNNNNNDSSTHSHVVKVLPFIESILGKYHHQDGGNWKSNEITSNVNIALHHHHPLPSSFTDRVIVKMDVEKAEFTILHHLVRTGAISLINELLLECHYNTNLPKEKRDANIHIGYDDCVDLVDAIRDASNDQMEVVLWNSVKTATRTGRGYIERHGGFFPT